MESEELSSLEALSKASGQNSAPSGGHRGSSRRRKCLVCIVRGLQTWPSGQRWENDRWEVDLPPAVNAGLSLTSASARGC